MSEEGDNLSKEELEAIQKDINSAKQALSSKEAEELINKTKEETRAAVEKELKLKQELEAKEAKLKELEEKLKEKELESTTKIAAIQKRIDEIISSKQVMSSVNQPGNTVNPFDKLTDEAVAKIEENSARAFFGPALDRYGTE